jgi:hypothetical protein
MEAKSFFLPGRKQKEGRRDDPSTIVIGLYGHRDRQWQFNYTKSHSLANFVGIVVGFLNVSIIRLRSLLLAVALSF